MTEWIATRLGAFCTGNAGRVRKRTALLDRAARSCLLIDLGLAGRVTHHHSNTEIDTTVIGFTPADRLLAYVDENPEGSMEQVIEHRRRR